ncbi:MAG: ribosomal protein L7Ae-like protein [Paenibacillus sp. RIFOXYA1_FULL_44_5]|nr:MAG: ribosomal protein L7Ae-like protein [Paenibacillus sp. RIFOXYA1_FULL_44_5]
MSYEKVKQAQILKIGTKQTTKMIELGKAAEVFVAKDADPRVTIKIVNLCNKAGVQITYVESMKQLGKVCGIDVGAAVAAAINE